MVKSQKFSLALGIFFCLLTVLFVVFYYFNVFEQLTTFITCIYVAYFIGLAFLYNGNFNKAHDHKTTTKICYALSTLFILGSTAMLIYGFITGQISLFY